MCARDHYIVHLTHCDVKLTDILANIRYRGYFYSQNIDTSTLLIMTVVFFTVTSCAFSGFI